MSPSCQNTHPDSAVLAAFALGHLDDGAATLVADHLGVCARCERAVLDVPDDSVVRALRPTDGVTVTLPDAAAATGPVFDASLPPELRNHPRYRLVRKLGAGGMGVVYLAEHRLMEHPVALKVISKQLTASPSVVERFRREIRAVARLKHPNLVQAHDAEQEGDMHFLVMEFVEGEDLAALMNRQGPLPIDLACDCVRQAAEGLAHALTLGLVHRDVKPQNMILRPDGQIKLLDFGLASIAEEGGGAGLTETGQGMGTPDYMAPEQIRDAHSADTRADVYSLGCTLYHLLAGKPPFPGGNTAQKMAAHLEKPPTPLNEWRPDLPEGLQQVVEQMMAKDPAQRPQTPGAVAAALGPWCWSGAQPEGARGRRRRRRALVAALLLVAVALAFLVFELMNFRRSENGAAPIPRWVFPPRGPVVPPAGLKAGDPAPDLGQVTPLVENDFSSPGKNSFVTGLDQTTGIEFRLENNRYVVLTPQNGSAYAGPNVEVEGDFAFEVVGRTQEGGDQLGWGVGLTTPSEDPFPSIQLRRDGMVDVDVFLTGSRSAVLPRVEPVRPPVVHDIDDFNALLIVVRGGRLEIYVNGTAIGPAVPLSRPLGPHVFPCVRSWSRRLELKRCALWLLPPPEVPKGEEQRPPDLARVKPVIDDDFSNPNVSCFAPGRDDKLSYERLLEGDRYVIRHLGNPKGRWRQGGWFHTGIDVGEAYRGDVAIQAVGRVVSEGDHGWDVKFRTPARDQSVAVRLRRDGAVEVGEIAGKLGLVTQLGPIRHPKLLSGEQDNTLLVILRDGQRLEIYVNGAAVCRPITLRQRLDAVVPGVGLWERGTDPPHSGRAEFRRFTLWRLSK